MSLFQMKTWNFLVAPNSNLTHRLLRLQASASSQIWCRPRAFGWRERPNTPSSAGSTCIRRSRVLRHQHLQKGPGLASSLCNPSQDLWSTLWQCPVKNGGLFFTLFSSTQLLIRTKTYTQYFWKRNYLRSWASMNSPLHTIEWSYRYVSPVILHLEQGKAF